MCTPAMPAAAEQDLRLRLLNTLLTTPHRRLEEVWPVHREMAGSDPRFYVRLAAWYFDTGEVRDHKEMFVVTLCLSDFPGHRDVGLALLRNLPPYEVVRVLDFVNGRKTTKKVRAVATAGAAKGAARTGTAKLGGSAAADVAATEVTESFGLFVNPPRSMRTEIGRYLREREADADWFDSTVLSARKAVKRLYALNHVKPGGRAQRVLFDRDPPADSRLFALKALARAKDPTEQAKAIVENAIPYRVAASVVKKMTPDVLMALIHRMSPQEVINNVASLTKHGVMEDPGLKLLVDEKLGQAKAGPGAGRVSAFKAARAVEQAQAVGLSDDVKAKLEQVADARVKAKGRIKRPTALLIDKSGSMQVAIELGKRIAAMISAVCEADLFVYAFDTIAYPIDRPSAGGSPARQKGGEAGGADDLASWERALLGITAGGGTSCGVAVESMRLRSRYVEQIILVTDEGENTAPLFADALKKYREQAGADPNVCIVRTPGAGDGVSRSCQAAGVPADVFQFAGDYYSLPNLIPLLSRPSRLELLTEIMEYPLPVRRPA